MLIRVCIVALALVVSSAAFAGVSKDRSSSTSCVVDRDCGNRGVVRRLFRRGSKAVSIERKKSRKIEVKKNSRDEE